MFGIENNTRNIFFRVEFILEEPSLLSLSRPHHHVSRSFPLLFSSSSRFSRRSFVVGDRRGDRCSMITPHMKGHT